jgi:hypothetical protein
MRAGRPLVLVALALVALGLSAVAASRGLPSDAAETMTETTAAACSSCDARHQDQLRRIAERRVETAP